MVATILIVAITVVLAAVLYFLVTGLTHTSTGTPPLGTAFAWGAPSNTTGSPTLGCADTAHYCYHIDIAWTGTDIRVSSLTLSLENPGGPVAWPTSLSAAGGSVKLISSTSPAVIANYWVTNLTWQVLPPFTGSIAGGSSIVMFCGGAAEGAGQGLSGLELVAVGASGYTGTVPSGVFP